MAYSIHHKPILPMARKKVKKTAVKKPFFSLNFDDDRIPKILGIICIFLALYLAIAQHSKLFGCILNIEVIALAFK